MSTLLAYGSQPAQAQPGHAVLLEYAVAAGGTQTVRLATHGRWTQSARMEIGIRNPMPPAAVIDTGRAAPWGINDIASRLASADFVTWGAATVADTDADAPWGAYGQHPAQAPLVPWDAAISIDRHADAPWGEYAQRRNDAFVAEWRPIRWPVIDQPTLAPWAGYAQRHNLGWLVRSPRAVPVNPAAVSPWGTFNRRLDPNWGVVTPDNNPPTDPNGTIVTPVLRSYIVLNEISLVRVSNSLALPALALSINADADSWTYSWQATVPGDNLDDVLPATPGEPIEFEASINGWPHRLLAEQISLDRSFGKPRVNISGRGIAALLAAPYAASEARSNAGQARTANQLCEDALLINGVPASGWTVDFNLTDWLVPAGAWVTLGSPMDAIAGIAAAAGGYVRADATSKILHIESRYPVAPWDWGTATPDFQLPDSATTKVGIEWRENPPYNAVYVSGTGPDAILARVKRFGTAGDIVAPMETDPLAVHADACRQRGTAVLGNAGKGQTLTLETPILDTIGPYPVGSLIRFVDGGTNRVGLVRACAISAAMPRVRQTLEVECHD
ncbi:MAG: hypothetical protein AB1443_09825 [Pseudomonadota bacterium]